LGYSLFAFHFLSVASADKHILYLFEFLLQILDEMPVFYNLNSVEKREVLVVVMQIIRNLDESSLVKAWQQSIARTRLFFKLLEECLILFEVSTQMESIMHVLQTNLLMPSLFC